MTADANPVQKPLTYHSMFSAQISPIVVLALGVAQDGRELWAWAGSLLGLMVDIPA